MSENVKVGAPDVGLYLVCHSSETEDLIPTLRQVFLVFNRSEYEKNMHVLEIVCDGDDEKNRAGTALLVELAKANGVVALVRDDYKLAAEASADGVMLSNFEELAQARDTFGKEEAIVGLRCRSDKVLAQKAFEAGVDFAGFSGDVLKMSSWWSALANKPCLVEAVITNDNCGAYVKAGATFLNASDYVFGYEKGVMQAAVNMLFAMEEVQQASLN